jgi:hypothetical protein
MLIVVENSRARLRDISTPSPQESGKEEIREGAGGVVRWRHGGIGSEWLGDEQLGDAW